MIFASSNVDLVSRLGSCFVSGWRASVGAGSGSARTATTGRGWAGAEGSDPRNTAFATVGAVLGITGDGRTRLAVVAPGIGDGSGWQAPTARGQRGAVQGARPSRMVRPSRAQTPTFFSAALSNNRPASEDWLPPSKSTVSFLARTAGRSKGSGVASVMAVAFRCDASTLVSTTVCYAIATTYATAIPDLIKPDA